MKSKLLYQGDLDDTKLIYTLMNEVKDIAKTFGWHYEEIDTSWQKAPEARMENCAVNGMRFVGTNGIKGLNLITAEGHEIPLLFDAQGALTNTFQVAMQHDPHYPGQRQWISTSNYRYNSQSQKIIHSLFEYLKSKYISNLDFRFYPKERDYDPTSATNHYSAVLSAVEHTSQKEEYPSFDAYMNAILKMLDRLF
jgi:hypothetical protein